MGIGLISEIAQIPGPRDAQLKDLVVDAMAIMGALGMATFFDKQLKPAISKRTHLLLATVAGLALAITCVPRSGTATLWFNRNEHFLYC